MTTLVLSQVYVSWAQYMSSVEDYQISKEIADTSENIAEDTVLENGGKAEKSQLEAARAIEDEAKAFAAYTDVRSRWATFMPPSVWMRCHTLCLKKSRPKLPSICAAYWKMAQGRISARQSSVSSRRSEQASAGQSFFGKADARFEA